LSAILIDEVKSKLSSNYVMQYSSLKRGYYQFDFSSDIQNLTARCEIPATKN
jgi:hypothetical protein